MSISIIERVSQCYSHPNSENVKELGVLQSQHFNGMSQTLATQSEMIKDLNSSQTALHTKSHVYLQTIETLTQKSTTTIENTIASAVAASQGVLSSKLESLDRRLESSDFVTKQFLAIELDRAQRQLTQELIQELTQVIHSVAPNTSEPVYTTVSTTQNIVRKSVSVCFNNWNYYRLPIGQFQVSTRSKRIQYDTGTEGTNERSFGVQFEFFPAPWLSNKSIVASFQRYYDRSRTPRFGTNMYFPITVSKDHPPFRAMEKDDIALLQHLLGSGLARPNDRDKDGWTLLHVSPLHERGCLISGDQALCYLDVVVASGVRCDQNRVFITNDLLVPCFRSQPKCLMSQVSPDFRWKSFTLASPYLL